MPALAFLFLFLLMPLAVLLSFAFLTIERGVATGNGPAFDHIMSILTDSLFWQIWWRSFLTATWTTLLCLLFGYPLALVYMRLGAWGRRMILVAIVAPLLTSALVRSYAWIVILGRQGAINHLLLQSGLISEPLRMLNGNFAVIVGLTQIQLPFMTLPLIAALDRGNSMLERASEMLGASRVQTLFRVTLPLSGPGIIAGSALVFALSYGNLIVPQMLGGGAYGTLATQVYEQIIVVLDWTRGAVLTLLLLLSSIVFVWIIARLGVLVFGRHAEQN